VSWDFTCDLFGITNSNFLQASFIFSIARRKSFVSLVTYSNVDIGHSRRCSTSFGSVQCKLYCAISSAWPGVELRFFPWLLLFKYWTDGSNLCSSVCRYYVYLSSWQMNERGHQQHPVVCVVIHRGEWDCLPQGQVEIEGPEVLHIHTKRPKKSPQFMQGTSHWKLTYSKLRVCHPDKA
jgi:hypothetical protein